MVVMRPNNGDGWSETVIDNWADAIDGFTTDIAFLNSLYQCAYRTTNGTARNNNITLLADSALLLPVEANAVYSGKLTCPYVTHPTADFKWELTYPASATMDWQMMAPQMSTSAGTTPPEASTRHSVGSSGQASPSGALAGGHASGGGSPLPVTMIVEFMLVIGATAGNLQFWYAQSTGFVGDTYPLRGAKLETMRVS